MTTDKARIKILEAEQYIEDAQARAARDDEYSPSIAISHANDAIILAVDALCHDRALEPAKRHDQAEVRLAEMVLKGLLPPQGSQWRDFLRSAIQQRSAFQYQGELTSYRLARRFVDQAAHFVAFARSQIRI